uniref:Putative head tail connector protein n=1 Tax=viral metagenome TaxID=1070528 RepID=A0A6M3KUL5_9ZZZZ
MLDWQEKSDLEIAKFCVSQQGRFEKVREAYEPMYEAGMKLFQPRRYDLSQLRKTARTAKQKKEQYGVGVYNQRPALALSKFATGSTGNMVSRDEEDPWWLQFVSEKQAMMQVDEVKQYMQNSAEQVKFGFNQSTFYQEFPMLMADAGVTYGGMTAEAPKDQDRLIFLTRHPADHWVGLDRFGQVIADHFKLKMTAYDIYHDKEFGKTTGADGKSVLPADLVKKAGGGEGMDPFTEYDVLHCIYKNTKPRPGSLNYLDKPYIMFYVLIQGRDKGPVLLSKEGSDWGVINLRIGATLGDAYPLTMALDAMTGGCYGNLLAKYKLMSAHLSVQPPRRASKTLRDQIMANNLNPASTTWIDDPKEIIEYLRDAGAKWPIADAELAEINAVVDDVFHVRFFELLTGGERTPNITAYHVGQMVSEKVPMLSPIIDASQDAVLEPASSIVWAYETMAGRMPEPPDILLEATGGKVLNHYMGRLAQLRRTLRQNSGTLEILQICEIFQKLWPSSLAKIRHFEFIERACLQRGAAQSLFHTDAEMDQIEAGMAEKENMEMQLQAAERLGKIIPGMGKGIEANSPAAMMTGAA